MYTNSFSNIQENNNSNTLNALTQTSSSLRTSGFAKKTETLSKQQVSQSTSFTFASFTNESSTSASTTHQISTEAFSSLSIRNSLNAISKSKSSSYYSKIKLVEAPRQISQGFQSHPTLSIETATSAVTQDFKNTRVAKLWNNAKKPLTQDPQIWNEKPEDIREKIGESLRKFSELTSDFPFAFSILQDFKGKSLHEIVNKYFLEQKKSLFNFDTPFSMELYNLLTLGDLFQTDIHKAMDVETRELSAKIIDQSREHACNRNEMLRLMIYLKSLKRAEKNANFEGYVVDAHEFKDFLNLLHSQPPETKPHRLQVLVRSDVHYTAVDINIGENSKECLVMDAAMDERFMNIVEDLKNTHFDTVYVAGIPAARRASEFQDVRVKINESLQLDSYSCSAFGFHLLSRSSKRTDLFDFLNSHSEALDTQEGVRYLSWKKFPADFIQTAQYPKFFLQKEVSSSEPFKDAQNLGAWVKQHISSVEEGGKKRETNTLIQKKFAKYGHHTAGIVENLSTEDLAKIAFAHPNSVYQNKHGS